MTNVARTGAFLCTKKAPKLRSQKSLDPTVLIRIFRYNPRRTYGRFQGSQGARFSQEQIAKGARTGTLRPLTRPCKSACHFIHRLVSHSPKFLFHKITSKAEWFFFTHVPLRSTLLICSQLGHDISVLDRMSSE